MFFCGIDFVVTFISYNIYYNLLSVFGRIQRFIICDIKLYMCTDDEYESEETIVKSVNIVGGNYAKLGRAVQLACNTDSAHELSWSFNDKSLTSDPETGVNIVLRVRGHRTVSLLEIKPALAEHAGEYSCVRDDGESDSRYMDIVDG